MPCVCVKMLQKVRGFVFDEAVEVVGITLDRAPY